jgi:hypothetical protein
MLIVGCNVYLWLRATGSTNRIAWLGAGVFAAFAVTYAHPYAGINDPQWLGHALMTSGLVVMWRGNASTRAIALGALLVIAGGWSKHSIVALPIATTWWLLRRSGWAFLTWIACCAVLMAVAAILVWKLYGIAFVHSLLFARQYSMHQAIKDTRTAFKCFAPIIALSLLLLPRARGSQKTEFAIVYLLVAAVVATLASGGIGIDINKYFDLMISASLCAALAIAVATADRGIRSSDDSAAGRVSGSVRRKFNAVDDSLPGDPECTRAADARRYQSGLEQRTRSRRLRDNGAVLLGEE